MYSKHKIILIIIFIVSFIMSFIFDCKLDDNIIQNLITFFSIVFGFYLTAISTLYGTKYLKKLNSKIDNYKKKSQTQLQTLRDYFKYSCYWGLFSITVLILCQFFQFGNFELYNNLRKILICTIISISTGNIVFIILLLKIFLNGFISEAMEK
jgi:hypothetical protein